MTTTPPGPDRARAWFRGIRARDVIGYADLAREPEALADGGWWVVVAEFDGPLHAWRFADVHRTGAADAVVRDAKPWHGPAPEQWRSTMSRTEYVAAVEAVRAAVLEGEVYQANICRVLAAPLAGPQPQAVLPDGGGWRPDAAALAVRLATGNPAPYAALIDVPAGPEWPGSWVVSASPELSVRVRDGYVTSGPIKGTAVTAEGLGAKDRAENVMITDLVRNDLARVCVPGTVEVIDLLATEEHPGLVHLVSRVRGELAPGRGGRVDWAALLGATHPPGSVSGAPKSSALRLIGELEPTARGPYCGQIGWLDADAGEARLAVGIRTFWWADQALRFGTGAGITWGSDAAAEWEETELKARRLVGLASTSR